MSKFLRYGASEKRRLSQQIGWNVSRHSIQWVTGELWGKQLAGIPDGQRGAGRMSPPGKDPQPAVPTICTLCQGKQQQSSAVGRHNSPWSCVQFLPNWFTLLLDSVMTVGDTIRQTCLGLKWGPPPEPLLRKLKQHMTVYQYTAYDRHASCQHVRAHRRDGCFFLYPELRISCASS